MTRIQQVLGTVGAAGSALLLLSACGGDPERDSSGQVGNVNGAGSSAQGQGQGGAGGTGNFGNAAMQPTMMTVRGTTPVKPGDLHADCTGETQNAKHVDVDMYIMLDRSNSMTLPTGAGVSKWDAVRSALTSFVSDPKSDNLGVGLQFFPLAAAGKPETCKMDSQCGSDDACLRGACVPRPGANLDTLLPCLDDSDCPFATTQGCAVLGQCAGNMQYACFQLGATCQDDMGNDLGACTEVPGGCLFYSTCSVGDYAKPAVEIGVLPGNGMALVDSLTMRMPNGSTPTPPALEGALEHAAEYAQSHPTHRVIAVLATDGLPTECTPESATTDEARVDSVVNVAAAGLRNVPAVETYVIGVFAPQETTAMPNLERIAKAGGTEHPFIVDASQDVNQQFLAALDEIRGGTLDCEFGLPKAPDGKDLDYKLVNVELTDKAGKRSLEYVGDEGHCADSALGWFYDADPLNGGTPSKISVCATTCDTLRKAEEASVEIRLGCASITPM